jgi:DNA-binding winged helix-turn-helix (wHTH) protein/predicted ATPase
MFGTVGPTKTLEDVVPDLPHAPAQLLFGPFSLDIANARLSRDGRAIELVPKDLDVLCFLAQRPGRLVSKDELLDAVWQRRFVSESVLKNGISRLRAALGDDARQPRYIETAQRRGYRFIGEQLPAPAATPAARPATTSMAQPSIASGAWIERPAAMAWLQRQLAAAGSGSTRLALLTGEAGIGKSCLIERFARESSQDQALFVASCQCVEHTAGVEPYLPMLDALNALCRMAPEFDLVALMRQTAPSWLLQLPWLLAPDDRLALQREVAGTTPERMLRECGEFLDRATEGRPLLLLMEDLHWCDSATLQLIGYLARRRGSARLMLLASLRPAEAIASDHPASALRLALREQRLGEELELELFSEKEAAHFLEQRSPGVDWHESTVRGLHEQTGGLPLFLAAVADELHAEGTLAKPVHPAQSVPQSVFGLIERQLERLPERTQRWLEAAAVLGVGFLHTPLACALEVEADTLQASFDSLVRQRAWLRELDPIRLPDGSIGVRYEFNHAIYRHVLYERVGAAARLQLHRRMAQALLHVHRGQTDEIAAEVAMHFEKGQDAAQAVRYLALAARRALQRFAAAEGAAIAQRAMSLLDMEPDRAALRDTEVELNVVIGVALAATEGVASAASSRAFHRTLRLLNGLQESAARVPAMHGIWWSTLVRGEIARAYTMAAHALALADARDDAALRFAGCAAMGMTLVHQGEFAAAQAQLSNALDLLDRLGAAAPSSMFTIDPAVQLTTYLAESLWWQGQTNPARQHSERALALAERLKHPTSLLLALDRAAMLRCYAADFESAARLSQRALELCQQHQLQRELGTCQWIHGRARMACGETDVGLALMQQGRLQQLGQGLVFGLTRWHEWFAQACIEVGRLDDADAAIREGLALAEHTGEHAASSALHGLNGRLLVHGGHTAEAQIAFAEADRIAQVQGIAMSNSTVIGAATNTNRGSSE